MRTHHCALSWRAIVLAAFALAAMSLCAFALEPPTSPPIRIAVKGDDRARLAGLAAREFPFVIVGVAEEPDLVWDPLSRDVTSGATVIAYGIAPADLADIIDRTAVVGLLQHIESGHAQPIRVEPAEKLHAGDKMTLNLEGASTRHLLLVDITGSGAVTLLYPDKADNPDLKPSSEITEMQAAPPFGTDILVAVTTDAPLKDLRLRLLDTNVVPAPEFLRLLNQSLTPDSHIGVAAVTTAP